MPTPQSPTPTSLETPQALSDEPSSIALDPKALSAALRAAVAEMKHRSPWPGLVRLVSLGVLCLGGGAIAWSAPQTWQFALGTAIAAVFYAFWLVCTHDAVHQTLTGWRWVDAIAARLISWPILWPVGTYDALHRLHHRWNGCNLDDPERTQWTAAELSQAGVWGRGWVRHQWAIAVLLCGSVGLVGKAWQQGWRQRARPAVRRQLRLDAIGMLVLHAGLLGVVIATGAIGRYVLFWLITERVVGVIMQAREHLEHYGLWGGGEALDPALRDQPLLLQLYATRNLESWAIANWLMGGLPYHSIHHAFPHIPWHQLPAANAQIQAILAAHGAPPLTWDPGYGRTAWKLSQRPIVIDATGRAVPLAALES